MPKQIHAVWTLAISTNVVIFPCCNICYYVCHTGVAVRLVGGSSYNEGRVEVNYNGEWGTVCDDGWSGYDARVVCRQLGFGSYGYAYIRAYFGQGSGPIWLDNVLCAGVEATLASCGHLGVNVTRSCTRSEDAGVRCYGGQGTYARMLYSVSCIDIQVNKAT